MTNTKALTNNIAQNTHTQRTVFRVLIACLIALSLVYAYLIGSITFNVLARKSLTTTARTLGSRVGELELSYLNATSKIDKNYAQALGFVSVDHNIYASRSASRVAVR